MTKWVPGWTGIYSVSDTGQVFSQYVLGNHKIAVGKSRPMKLFQEKSGYLAVMFKSNRQWFRYRVHRLVLFAFRGTPPVNCECAHLDGNPQNNKLSNLAWVTKSVNNLHKAIHGTLRHGENHPMAKLTYKEVDEAFKLHSVGRSQTEIASRLCVSKDTVGKILRGETWCHYTKRTNYL